MFAFGFLKRKVQEDPDAYKIVMNAPFAFALGSTYRTNKAYLIKLSDVDAKIHIPINEEIPDLNVFSKIPMSFRLPGDQTTWSCNVDITRIFAYDKKDNQIYGMHLLFRDFTDEQKEQLRGYISSRKNVMQQQYGQQQAVQQQQAQQKAAQQQAAQQQRPPGQT
jgi:hypothetical protein